MKRNITFESLQKQYLKLITNPSVSEETLHKFFIKYPIFLPLFRPYENKVFTKFRLGNQYVADFAFARENSPGVKWYFIEIEKPSFRVVNNRGCQTKQLSQGLSQLDNWRDWFYNNKPFVEKNFPYKKEASRIGLDDPRFILIIGRREAALNLPLTKRLALNGPDVLSFDRGLCDLTSPAVDLLKPIEVCSYVMGSAKTISKFKINISYDISMESNI